MSDTGVNLNSIDQLNIDLNDANNNLTYSLQALNILGEVIVLVVFYYSIYLI